MITQFFTYFKDLCTFIYFALWRFSLQWRAVWQALAQRERGVEAEGRRAWARQPMTTQQYRAAGEVTRRTRRSYRSRQAAARGPRPSAGTAAAARGEGATCSTPARTLSSSRTTGPWCPPPGDIPAHYPHPATWSCWPSRARRRRCFRCKTFRSRLGEWGALPPVLIRGPPALRHSFCQILPPPIPLAIFRRQSWIPILMKYFSYVSS